MTLVNPSTRRAAEQILAYLGEVDAPPTEPVDAVIGMGVFDLTLPRFCAELYVRGDARRIIFTGGYGGGTGDLGGPEADVWREEVRRTHPDIPDAAFLLENTSTNTAENIQFTAALLTQTAPDLAFGRGTNHVIIVASPSRLRRAWLTFRHREPQLRVTRRLPRVDFDAELALYTRQGVDYLGHLVGELDRLVTYPARGWIAAEALPPDIVAAGTALRAATKQTH